MPHFITTHSINNPNYIKMQQNKNQQLDAKFRKFIKVLIMGIVTLPYSFIVIMSRSIIKRLYGETSAYFVLKGGNVAV